MIAKGYATIIDKVLLTQRRTADFVQMITSSSNEQPTGVTHINSSMGELHQSTQQHATTSEALAATAEELSAQALQLQQAMAFFTLRKPRRCRVMVVCFMVALPH